VFRTAILKSFVFLTRFLPQRNAKSTKTRAYVIFFLCDLCVLLWPIDSWLRLAALCVSRFKNNSLAVTMQLKKGSAIVSIAPVGPRASVCPTICSDLPPTGGEIKRLTFQ
jgi:hypothetical protein